MKLSVLVPAYNLVDYIGPCLESLVNQVVDFDFEILVCDDASTDHTAEVIRKLVATSSRISPIYKTVNGGLAANMQSLLDVAKGEYIAYLDGDDLACPGKLQTQVKYLDSNPDCGMVFHESEVFDSKTNQSIRLYTEDYYNWPSIPLRSGLEHLIRYGTYMQASSVMFRRHQNLGKTVAADCKIILDYPFYILTAGFLEANIDFIPDVLGRYRVHDSSFGAQTARSSERREQAMLDMIHACELARQFGVDEGVVQAGISHHYYCAALYFLQRGNDRLFLKYIVQSAVQGAFFDQRHEAIVNQRARPNDVRALLAG